MSAYILSTRQSFKFQVVTGRSATARLQRLGSYRYLAALVCFAILFFEFILPFGGLVFISSAKIFASNLNSVQVNFPAFYLVALKIPFLFDSLRTTLSFGLIAAALATMIGALLSYMALKSRTRGARFADFISAVPLAFPGVVYGVALFWTFLLIPGLSVLYGTIWPLVIALVFIRLPFSTRIVSSNMVQISNDLEDASQVAGSRFTRTFTRILMPLIKEGLFNSFVYTLIDSMRELGGVVILATVGTPTFTTLLLQYYNSDTSVFGAVAAASVMFTGHNHGPAGGCGLGAPLLGPDKPLAGTANHICRGDVLRGMATKLWTEVERYFDGLLIPADPAMDAALKASSSAGLPPINVTPSQGRLLWLLARVQGARKILEIGTLGGYSAIWMASALPAGGRLLSLEVDPNAARGRADQHQTARPRRRGRGPPWTGA